MISIYRTTHSGHIPHGDATVRLTVSQGVRDRVSGSRREAGYDPSNLKGPINIAT